jgi:predicted TIM-barrel fold metal-dependent hydrolase
VTSGADGALSTPRIIDTHVHVWELGEGPGRQLDPTSPVRPVEQSAPIESLLEDIDGHGIGHCVLVQHSAFGADNTYILECLRKVPGRFRAIGLIDLFSPRAPEHVEELMARGLSGFRFHPTYFKDASWLDGTESDAVWRAAERTNAILEFHMRPAHADAIGRMARRHPHVRVIIDHMGKPDVTEAAPYHAFQHVAALASCPNIWMKIGDYEKASSQKFPWNDTWPFVEILHDRFGTDRLLWGTGFPGPLRRVPLDQAVRYVTTELPFSAAERQNILWDTPAALFSFAA